MATNGSEVIAGELLTALLSGEDVTIPSIDLSGSEYIVPGDEDSDAYDVIEKLGIDDVTTGSITGTGVFDKIMVGIAAQLKGEYDSGRITGTEYTKAYIALVQAGISSSIQYLLSKDVTYWQTVQAQVSTITSKVQLATAKTQNAAVQLEALNVRATYALTKLQLAKTDSEYGAAKYNLEELLPVQKLNLQEQSEAQRAQTMDTRSDGTTAVAGSIGKQNSLYAQQIVSYQKDSQLKAAKIFSDVWTVRKSVDDGTGLPANFDTASVDAVMEKVKTSNDLVE